MRRHLGALTALLAFASLLAMPARARAEDSLAVLGVESVEVGEALGNQITDALRRKAAETPGVRLVPGKDLIELKMVFGCDGEAPACLAQAGRSLGADRLIYGSLRKAENGRSVAVSLKVLDVRELQVVKQVSENVPKKQLTTATIPAAVARWFGQLVVPPQTGGIVVNTQPPEANVLVDGAPAGKAPVRMKDLRPRSYSISAQLDGYDTATQTVEVTAGNTENVILKLNSAAPDLNKPPRVGVVEPPIETSPGAQLTERPHGRHPGRAAKYAAIGLAAGAVVAGAVAIYTWRSYLKLEDSASSHLRDIAPAAGTTEQRIFFAAPSCNAPPGITTSDTSRSYVSDCNSGNKFAAATTGLWVTAGVLASAGIVSFIVGQRQSANAEKADRDRRAHGLQQSLRLLPAVSTTGGGLTAKFEF